MNPLQPSVQQPKQPLPIVVPVVANGTAYLPNNSTIAPTLFNQYAFQPSSAAAEPISQPVFTNVIPPVIYVTDGINWFPVQPMNSFPPNFVPVPNAFATMPSASTAATAAIQEEGAADNAVTFVSQPETTAEEPQTEGADTLTATISLSQLSLEGTPPLPSTAAASASTAATAAAYAKHETHGKEYAAYYNGSKSAASTTRTYTPQNGYSKSRYVYGSSGPNQEAYELYASGEYETALKSFNTVMSSRPDLSITSYILRARILYAISLRDNTYPIHAFTDIDKVIEVLQKSQNFSTDKLIRALQLRAKMKYNLYDLYGALKDYNAILNLNRNHRDTLIYRGIIYFELRKFAEAKQDFNRAVRGDRLPSNRAISYMMAMYCLESIGKKNQEEAFSETTKYFNIILTSAKKERLIDGIQQFQALLYYLKNDFLRAKILLDQCDYTEGDHTAAILKAKIVAKTKSSADAIAELEYLKKRGGYYLNLLSDIALQLEAENAKALAEQIRKYISDINKK